MTTVLTRCEQEALQWAAEGKSNWEIGMILGISKHAVAARLRQTYAKLDTSNRIHAVTLAMRQGLIR